MSTQPRDLLASLAIAKTLRAEANDISLYRHVSECKHPRPCPDLPECDLAKERLEHFRTCSNRSCDTCAMARLISVAEHQRGLASRLQSALTERRAEVSETLTAIKTATARLAEARKHRDHNNPAQVVSEAKISLESARNRYLESKAKLQGVCMEIFDAWSKVRVLSSDDDGIPLPVSGDSTRSRQTFQPNLAVAETPPKEPVSPHTRLPIASGNAISSAALSSQTSNNADIGMLSTAATTTESASLDAGFPVGGTPQGTKHSSSRSLASRESTESPKQLNSEIDPLLMLIKARTPLASVEDVTLREHVDTCTSPLPCPYNAACDIGKERLEHFQKCRNKTCDTCTMARLIEAQAFNRSVANLQLPLIKARQSTKHYYTKAKLSVDDYICARNKLNNAAEVESLRPVMSRAKEAHESARKEYARLCSEVYEQWIMAKQGQTASHSIDSAEGSQMSIGTSQVISYKEQKELGLHDKYSEVNGTAQSMESFAETVKRNGHKPGIVSDSLLSSDTTMDSASEKISLRPQSLSTDAIKGRREAIHSEIPVAMERDFEAGDGGGRKFLRSPERDSVDDHSSSASGTSQPFDALIIGDGGSGNEGILRRPRTSSGTLSMSAKIELERETESLSAISAAISCASLTDAETQVRNRPWQNDAAALLISLARATTHLGSETDMELFSHVSSCSIPSGCRNLRECDTAKRAWAHLVQCDDVTCNLCTPVRILFAQTRGQVVAALRLPLARAREALAEAAQQRDKANERGETNKDKLNALDRNFQRASGAVDFLSQEVYRAWLQFPRPSLTESGFGIGSAIPTAEQPTVTDSRAAASGSNALLVSSLSSFGKTLTEEKEMPFPSERKNISSDHSLNDFHQAKGRDKGPESSPASGSSYDATRSASVNEPDNVQTARHHLVLPVPNGFSKSNSDGDRKRSSMIGTRDDDESNRLAGSPRVSASPKRRALSVSEMSIVSFSSLLNEPARHGDANPSPLRVMPINQVRTNSRYQGSQLDMSQSFIAKRHRVFEEDLESPESASLRMSSTDSVQIALAMSPPSLTGQYSIPGLASRSATGQLSSISSDLEGSRFSPGVASRGSSSSGGKPTSTRPTSHVGESDAKARVARSDATDQHESHHFPMQSDVVQPPTNSMSPTFSDVERNDILLQLVLERLGKPPSGNRLLAHVASCSAGVSCPFVNCPSAKSSLAHFAKCSSAPCLVCTLSRLVSIEVELGKSLDSRERLIAVMRDLLQRQEETKRLAIASSATKGDELRQALRVAKEKLKESTELFDGLACEIYEEWSRRGHPGSQ